MTVDFTSPIVQSIALPFFMVLAVIAFLRGVWGPMRAERFGAVAVFAGFLAFYVLRRGLPQWPPEAALTKLPFVLLLGLVAGFVLHRMRHVKPLKYAILIALPATAIIWIAFPVAGAPPLDGSSLHYGMLVLMMMVIFLTLADESYDFMAAPITLTIAVAGLAGIAAIYGSQVSLYASALAAALAAITVLNLVGAGLAPGISLILVGGSGYAALASTLFFMRGKLVIPVALTAAVFIAPPLARWIAGHRLRALPLVMITLALIPVGVALYLISLRSGG